MQRRKLSRGFELEAVKLMAENGVTCSMGRSGNVWDNAAMEELLSI